MIGALALGAFGSGLWDWLVKPALVAVGKQIFEVLTFNLEAAKDSIYENIALGQIDRWGLTNHSCLLILTVGAVMAVTLSNVSEQRELERMVRRTFGLDKPHAKQSEVDENVMKTRMQRLVRIMRIMNVGLIASFLMMIGSMAFEGIKTGYEADATNHFYQSLAICDPFLDKDQAKQIASQFSRIKHRSDYLRVINTLDAVAREHSLQLKPFSVW